MRWDVKKPEDIEMWHAWFAWYPVALTREKGDPHQVVWLETLERRVVRTGWAGQDWEYRL